MGLFSKSEGFYSLRNSNKIHNNTKNHIPSATTNNSKHNDLLYQNGENKEKKKKKKIPIGIIRLGAV